MPSSSGLSSPLAPKGQLIMKHSTAVLLLSIVLLASSCEARGLPAAHGKVRSSSKSHRLPGKDVAEGTSLKADVWLTRQVKAAHMADQQEQVDAKEKEGMKMVASSTGADRATPTKPAVMTVSQRLSRREDTGFHLDYAGPRTHTPSHN